MAKRQYDNGEIIIHWDSDLCTHAGVCWNMLPKVFRPSEKPWVRPEFATTEKIINMIEKCPSGALTYELKEK